MDIRLFKASQTGDIQLLHQLLAENPLLLHSTALVSAENPLHLASIAGHVEFVKDILRFRPNFSKEMNNDGFSPMHIASANGYLEIVRELIKVDPSLCRLKGRDEWTPLHYAACRGRVDVIREIVLSCPESIEDVTVQGETALHLTVKNSQFEATKNLLQFVVELRKVNFLNMKDKLGNSVLHLATWKKQHQVVQWLVGKGTSPSGPLDVNNVNQSGLTPLDLLLIFPSEAGDREMEVILHGVGALRAGDIVQSGVPSFDHHHNHSAPRESDTNQLLQQQPNNLMEYFKFKNGRDSPSDARTALLVVAVLVATATYQLAANPPGGVWQDTLLNKNGTNSDTSNDLTHYAGTDIQGSYYPVFFIVFAVFNSVGFSVSLYMIEILTTNFPLQLELHVCILAMYFTYCNSVIMTAPGAGLYFLFALTPALPRMLQLLVKCARPLSSMIRLQSQPLLHHMQQFAFVNNYLAR